MSDEAAKHYTKIFLVLMAALVISMVIIYVTHAAWAVAGIFIIAAIKAYLVLTHFIHLGSEPKYIKVIVGTTLAVLVILYVTLIPDIVWVETGLP